MNIIKRFTSLSMTCLILLSACSASDRAITISELEGDATAGKAPYDQNCMSCHGATAQGGSGPNLVKEISEHDLADMIDVVLDGDGDMPGFSNLEDQEIADIFAYIKSL